jgi:DNA-binding response OmpR family regulator
LNRILLVEDEKTMAKHIVYFLEKEGFSVDSVRTGEDGLERFRGGAYDLLLVDWTLPGMDGLELCRVIRKESAVPIIMITAKEELVDKVVGLEVGADDYLTKPFHLRELLARIRALLRRSQMQAAADAADDRKLVWRGLVLDKSKLTLSFADKSVPLTNTEFKLLDLFMQHPQQVYTREILFETVWGQYEAFNDRTVDVNVSRLRKKIADLSGMKTLQAVRGIGYSLGERT